MIEITVNWDEVLDFLKVYWFVLVFIWYFVAWLVVRRMNIGAPSEEEELGARSIVWLFSPLAAPIYLVVYAIYKFFTTLFDGKKK
jgi:hypothetical protein